MKRFSICMLLLVGWVMAGPAHALAPHEVLVIANRNAADSHGLAKYYMKQRQIPGENLVLLWVTDKETCSREAYETKIIPPVRRALEANPDIRALVTVYGVPLRISRGPLPKDKKKREAREDTEAAVDSELSLVLHPDYDIRFWQPNPFYLGFREKKLPVSQSQVMMVARLDGPNPELVRRIIDDALYAEEHGLNGKMYLDARWPDPGKKKVSGYALYDRSLHKVARHHEAQTLLPVELDSRSELFGVGACPDTALYCGWYSLAKYVDSFTWKRGAVGYHMASSECVTLRKKDASLWCKNILEKGAAATVGPVGEPYIQGFPLPEIFFNLLTEGRLTLAEAYLVSLPYLSWKMVLIGDPLYRLNLNPAE